MFGRRTQAGTDERGDGGPAAATYETMVDEMIEHQLRCRGVVMHSVLEAMRAIPRHLFVPHEYSHRAYADEALPSLEGQTISQPYMVAVMTQELRVKPGQRILELGTGTGYQTAVLAWLAAPGGRVYTIERVPALAEFARHRLAAMEISNVRFLVDDGSKGWHDPAWDGPRSPEGEPLFDRIMVTAGTPEVPRPLLRQLADGGIMIIPIGAGDFQTLTRIEKHGTNLETTQLLECRFVPLVGAHAWEEGEAREQAADEEPG